MAYLGTKLHTPFSKYFDISSVKTEKCQPVIKRLKHVKVPSALI